MNLLKEAVEFLLRYYEIYLYVFAVLIICIIYYRKEKGWGNYKLLVVTGIFLVSLVCAYNIYRTPFVTETIRIEATGGSARLIRYTNFLEYYRVNMTIEGQMDLKLPVGRERGLRFATGPDAGTVRITYPDGTSEEADLVSDETSHKTVYLRDAGTWQTIILQAVLKAFVCMLLTSIICFAVKYLQAVFKYIWQWLFRWRYETAVFGVLSAQLILKLPQDLAGWSAAWYALDYEMVSGSRVLPGAILGWIARYISGGYIKSSVAFWYVVGVLVLIILAISCMLGQCIRKSDGIDQLAAVYVIICYLCSPGSIAYLWTEANMGRLETFVLFFTLLAVIAYHKFRNIFLKYGIVALLSIVAMASHQGYLFLYFVLLITVMAYDVFEQDKISWKHLAGSMAVCFATMISFLLFQFGSAAHFESAEEMVAALTQKTDLPISDVAVYNEYFSNIKQAYVDSFIYGFFANSYYPREKLFLTVCVLLPFIALILMIWQTACRESGFKTKKGKILTSPYLYMWLGDALILPQFLLNVDWGRWMAAMTGTAVFQILYLNYRGDGGMRKAFEKLGGFILRHKALSITTIIYLTILSKFKEMSFIPEVDRIWELIQQIGSM